MMPPRVLASGPKPCGGNNISDKTIYSYGICYRAKLLHGFNSNKINLDLILLQEIAT